MKTTLLRAAAADSALLRIGRVSPRSVRPVQANDDALDRVVIQLTDSSLPMRGLSRMGEFLRRIGQQSICAARLEQWMGIPAAGRLRLMAIAAAAAVLTHIILTGFSAPEPIAAARAGWAGLLLLLCLTATHSHAIVAAWTEWTARRRATTHEIP